MQKIIKIKKNTNPTELINKQTNKKTINNLNV